MLFLDAKCAKRRPESREETPKEASAASLLHCNNDPGTSFVQRKRRADEAYSVVPGFAGFGAADRA